MSNLNKFFTIASIVVFAIGCGAEPESENNRSTVAEVEEILAEKGDACDCVNSKVDSFTAILEKAEAGEYASEMDISVAVSEALKGCMEPTGNRDADVLWSQKMMECERFDGVKLTLQDIQTVFRSIKQKKQEEFVDGKSASEVLDKLQESH